jgi:D-alanyl-D-alanine carboxypeptidase (penicillin-binding protein 5/6)
MSQSTRATALLVIALLAGCNAQPSLSAAPPAATGSTTRTAALTWSHPGQASYALHGRIYSSPEQRPVPIASVAKVMTAYLVVQHLRPTSQVVVRASDVADTRRRRERGESVVPVATGEVLDRRAALNALLIPSANNVAMMLAERVAGSRAAFVRLMNEAAEDLGMHDTTYTDPSGYSDSTVSTAHDQVLLLQAALRFAELRLVMGSDSAVVPVAGRVHNTNQLLGHRGFVAGKTGSTSAAGGCLVFRVVRDGVTLDGAVLGQRRGPLVPAGLAAADELAYRVLEGHSR